MGSQTGVRPEHRPGQLFRVGLAIVAAGAAGDILHHTLPGNLAHEMNLLLGADGGRAHALTLAGMILTVVGLGVTSRRGPRHPNQTSIDCPPGSDRVRGD